MADDTRSLSFLRRHPFWWFLIGPAGAAPWFAGLADCRITSRIALTRDLIFTARRTALAAG